VALTSFVDTVSGKLSPGHNRGSPLEAVRTCFPETVSIDTQRRYVRVSVLREVRPNRPVRPPLKFLFVNRIKFYWSRSTVHSAGIVKSLSSRTVVSRYPGVGMSALLKMGMSL
jgi:hypothetical protein